MTIWITVDEIQHTYINENTQLCSYTYAMEFLELLTKYYHEFYTP